MYRIYATKDGQFVQIERDQVVDAFRAVRRLRELGWAPTLTKGGFVAPRSEAA
jgi:hypothetical protein